MSVIQTWTGRLVNPISLASSEIDIRDIARSLSCLCRFNGHVRQFYSVAQHCVLASAYIPEPSRSSHTDVHAFLGDRLNDQRCALLHDAHEAYLGDIVRPLKSSFYNLEDAVKRIDAAIAQRFGLRPPTPAVRLVDEMLLATERRDVLCEPFFGLDGKFVEIAWPDEPTAGPLALQIRPWTQVQAEQAFQRRFAELFGAAPFAEASSGDRCLEQLEVPR